MGIDQNNDANMKEIVDKYDLNSDRLFSSDEVKNMINDIQNSEPKFALSKKLFLVTGLVVAIVTFASQVTGSIQNQKVDKQFFELKPGSVADPTSIGHRQLDGHSNFDDWLRCEAVATIPHTYLEADSESDDFVFVCKSSEDCKHATSPPVAAPVDPPVAEPVDAPVAAPVAEPVDSPVAEPVDSPVAEPVDAPVAEPVAEPVDPPVASPVAEPAPVAAPVASPPTVAAECRNDPDYRFRDEEIKSCVWIGATETRRANLCDSRREVRENCPMVCGICCEDDPDFLGIQYPTGNQGCDFLKTNVQFALNYCFIEEIKTYCPQTCENCKAYISMAPSTDGTQRPTTTDRRNGVDDD